MTEWLTFWLALAGIVLGLAIATGVGLYVVNAHPNPSDPARSAWRFVGPAGFGACVAVLSAIVWLGSIVALFIP